MGVYKLGASLLSKIKGPGEDQPINQLPPIQHYFLDVNGILHKVAESAFGYKSGKIFHKNVKEKADHTARVKAIDNTPWQSLMKDYEKFLYTALNKLMSQVKPTTTICLCVDGIAPAAKIAQQQNRRKGGSTNISREYEEEGEVRAQTGFSSTFITPGTDFMVQVDHMLEKWVTTNKKKMKWITHIYSSHLLHGEGEHKIFTLIDNLDIGRDNDNYAIDGVDSDLVSLTLVRPQHFFLVRSERANFIDVDGLKQFVWNNMECKKKKFDPRLVLKDFVLLLYIVGNDFLPRFLFVEDVGETIFGMMKCYVNNTKITITTHKDTIDWNSFSHFLSCLTSFEEEMLKVRTSMYYAYPHHILHSDQAKRLSRQDGDEYMNYIRDSWYDYTLLPQNKMARQMLEDQSIDNEIDRACRDMCKGLLWVLRYYTGNTHSKSYSYNRAYAPLIVDIWRYVMLYSSTSSFVTVEEVTRKGPSDSFNIISQLMSVIPLKNNDLVPKPFNEDVLPEGVFGYMNPIGFPTKREGLLEYKDWFMQKSYLPLVDTAKMIDFVDNRRDMWPADVTDMIVNGGSVMILR